MRILQKNSRAFAQTRGAFVMAALLFILICFTVSSEKIIIKLLFFQMPSILFLFSLRMFLAAVLMLAGYYALGKKESIFNKDLLPYIIQGSVCRVLIPALCVIWSMKYMPLAEMTLLMSLGPFVAAFFSYLMLREKLSLKKWIGIIIGFNSVVPLILGQPIVTATIQDRGSLWILPELAIFVLLFTHHYGWTLMRKMVTRVPNLSHFAVNAYDALIGGSLGFLIFMSTGQPVPTVERPIYFIFMMLLLIVISSFVGRNIHAFLLKFYSQTLVSIVLLATPFFVAVMAWLVMGEMIGIRFFVSSILVVIGFAFFYWDETITKKIYGYSQE
jgi:drug/metabolite transporter (DMT)-like permease